MARTRLERAYAAAGTRLGTRLAAQLAGEKAALEPRLTPAKALAFAIALVIHLLTCGLAVGGGLIAVRAAGNPFAYVMAAVMLGAAWLMRPRTGHAPTDDRLSRARAPELHALIDDVAGALGTAAPDVVIVDDEYNASWRVAGLRRRRVLAVGMPLFDPLDAQERVALIAHELGHARNGDAGRGLIVGSAVQALAALYELVAPGSRLLARTWEISLAEPLANAFMWVVSRPVWWLLVLQAHLLWRDHQRAEFLADVLAARVAGTAGVVGLHEKTLFSSAIQGASHRALHHDGAEPFDLFGEIRRAVAKLPEHERERRRRIARREAARLDVTHPPTGQRITLLESRPRDAPKIVLDSERAGRIDLELEPLRPRIADRIVDRQRSSLYSG